MKKNLLIIFILFSTTESIAPTEHRSLNTQTSLNTDDNTLHIQTLLEQAAQAETNSEAMLAINLYQRILSVNPIHDHATKKLAALFFNQKQFDLSIIWLHKALRYNPSDQQILQQLIAAYKQQELYAQAAKTMASLIELNPNNLQHHFDIAYLYNMIGEQAGAIAAYQKVLDHVPHNLTALYNTAFTLKSHGKLHEAITLYEHIIKQNPDYEQAHFGLARAYLQQGNFEHGWHEYEWYLKKINRNSDELRGILATDSIAGKKIVLYPEGGLGDTIQFVRFAKTFKDLGAHVTVLAQKPLLPLLKLCPFIDQLYETSISPVRFDALVTMMNAPAVLKTEEAGIPQPPYLSADPALFDYWKPFFDKSHNVKIGICWQADVHNDSSRPPVARRGIPLNLLAQTLKNIPNTVFYSLQQKDGLEQLTDLPVDFNLHLFDDRFDKDHGPFMDTAATIMHLDCVITVDTAIAHLAGALNKKVILLLPYNTDWRWIVGRTNTPWYPSMTIIKQPKPFDWDSVMLIINEHLHSFLNSVI